ARRPLQNVVVPVARDSKAFCDQDGISRCVAVRRRVLAAVDFDDDPLFEANEIKNKVLKGDLATKLEKRKAPVAKQSPHGGLGVGRLATHLFCKTANALGGWSMVRRLRYEPLTRRLTA